MVEYAVHDIERLACMQLFQDAAAVICHVLPLKALVKSQSLHSVNVGFWGAEVISGSISISQSKGGMNSKFAV